MALDFSEGQGCDHRSFDHSRADSDQRRGHRAYVAGQAAEDCVARYYERLGARILERRWRAARAEVDLILRLGDEVIFVEVKSSRTFDRAAELVRWDQLHRVSRAAEVYIGRLGGWPPDMRIDVALVDGRGAVRLLENATMAA